MNPVSASLVRVLAICQKEVFHLVRDRLTFGMVIMIPLIQLILFGYTINTDVRNVPTAVADSLGNSFSRQLIMDLQATQVVTFTEVANSEEELQHLIREGIVNAGLYIPEDAEKRFYNGEEAVAQLLIDGSDTVLAAAVSALRTFPFSPGSVISNTDMTETLSTRLFYNPEKRTALFTVPGLLGIILTMTMILFTSIAIVRERERGNIELLIATPVKNLELMIGKMIPYIIIGLIQVGIILGLGVLLFQLPISATNIGPVYFASCIFILANLALGLMISTVAPNQLAAMQMFIFIFLPSILLSGFMFPFVAMPQIAQKIGLLLPVTHFIRVVRGLILRDQSLQGVMPDLYFLMGFALIFLTISTVRFTKKLE